MRRFDYSNFNSWSPIEEMHGGNRRETRKLRKGLWKWLASDRPRWWSPRPPQWLGTANAWTCDNGLTVVPGWLRSVPLGYGQSDHALAFLDGSKLVSVTPILPYKPEPAPFVPYGFVRGDWKEMSLPNGNVVYGYVFPRDEIVFEHGHPCIHQLSYRQIFYRFYNAPSKDIREYCSYTKRRMEDDCPYIWQKQAAEKAREEWRAMHQTNACLYFGLAELLYEEKSAGLARYMAVKRGGRSAKYNRRQLRALGFVA